MITYRDALRECGLRYQSMCHTSSVDILLTDFVEYFLEQIPTMPLCKLNRWLGFIQGTLIAMGITSVEAERDWTRPLFHPLDYPENEG